MKLKLDANGNVVTMKQGDTVLPVYVHDDNSERPFDAVSTVGTISRLNNEARTHREAKEALEATLSKFKGIDDPVAAVKALQTVKNLDDKKLVDANQVEQIRQETIRAVEAQYAPFKAEAEQLKQALTSEMIGGRFARSPLITGQDAKLSLPADLVQARFGQQFKIEDGKVVAYDSTGNRIFSRTRAGELADFDEALELIVEAYPHKNTILRGSGASGTGSTQGSSQNGKKTMPRTQFEALDPSSRASEIRAGTVVI